MIGIYYWKVPNFDEKTFLFDNGPHLRKVSCSCCMLQAKSKAQNDCGRRTSMPFLISTGGWVSIGAALPKNG